MKKAPVIIPVILCGGSGTRLWPLSRGHRPKQFLNLLGDFSLLQETARRALRITGCAPDMLVTVTLESMEDEVEKQLAELDPALACNILPEPCARNTAAAVALASVYVRDKFGDETLLWILPSDHYIGDENSLKASLQSAIPAARQGCMVTFGITPSRAETGYGYIHAGESFVFGTALRAQAFVEKPDAATAQSYLDSGQYLWNSGMFLFEAGSVLQEFRHLAPKFLKAVPSPDAYAALPSQPFDKAIMEKSQLVAVVPCDPAWSDIGSWESLWDISERDADGNAIEGLAACHATKNCLIKGNGRLIACAGIENIVVVETEDAILIADRRNAEAIKILAEGLVKSGWQQKPEIKEVKKEAVFLKKRTGTFKTLFWAVFMAFVLTGCADLKTAKTAHKAGDYKTAQAHWEELAGKGFPEAKLNLALMHLNNEAVPSDPVLARRLLEEAGAEEQNPRVHFELGKIYEEGEGIPADREKAIAYYTKAWSLGYARAAFQLGKMKEEQKDFAAADDYYRQAEAGGYERAAERRAALQQKAAKSRG